MKNIFGTFPFGSVCACVRSQDSMCVRLSQEIMYILFRILLAAVTHPLPTTPHALTMSASTGFSFFFFFCGSYPKQQQYVIHLDRFVWLKSG